MTPRFIPWDLPGRCSRCKSGTVEVDYVIQPSGVSIFSTRLKGGERFLPFDQVRDIDGGQWMRISARNKVFNLPLKRIEEKTEEAKPEMIPLPEEGKEQPEMIPETNI